MALTPAERNYQRNYGGDVPHEVVKCLAAWGLELDALLWNAVKYIARAERKGNYLQDLEKAAWYLNRRIEATRRQAGIVDPDQRGEQPCDNNSKVTP